MKAQSASIKTKMRKLLGKWVWRLIRPRNFGSTGSDVRIAFPRRLSGRQGIHLGDGVRIGGSGWIEAVRAYAGENFSPRISIGSDTNIGRFAHITAIKNVTIGEGCLFSEYVYVSDHVHGLPDVGSSASVSEMPLVFKGEVVIGPRCFVGIRAAIMPGVTLGEGCVVGANSVVTKSFPDFSIIAGAPAKLLRLRNDNKKVQ